MKRIFLGLTLLLSMMGVATSLQAQNANETDYAKDIMKLVHERNLRDSLASKDGVAPAEWTASIVELERIFKGLRENRYAYNETNDSIYHSATRGEWISLFRRRADSFAKIYAESSKLMRELTDICDKYEQHDIAMYNDSLRFADYPRYMDKNAHLRILLETLYQIYLLDKPVDIPFMIETIAKKVGPDMAKYMPHSELTMMGFAALLRSKYEMALLNDDESARRAVFYAREVLKFEDQFDNFSHDYCRLLFLSAYRHLLYIGLIKQKALTPEESLDYWHRAIEFRNKHKEFFARPENQKYLTLLNRNIDNYEFFYATSYQMKKDFHTAQVDSMMDGYLRRVEADGSFNRPDEFCEYATVKNYMGEWNIDEAYDRSHAFYKGMSYYPKDGRVTVEYVASVAHLVKKMLYMLAESSQPLEVKQVRMVEGMDIVLELIRDCQDAHSDYELADVARKLICNETINPYLNTDIRRSMMMRMMQSTQVQTYAHTQMVSRLCEEILEGVMTHRPDLLVGTFGITKPEEVKENTVMLSRFLTRAAQFHDIGKLTMIEVVRNDYHPLSDHEFEIIKKHPERGLQFLNIDESFRPYRDIILGHHKWYDGTKGYPTNFDNTKSPIRILIDIVTLADHMEAASDHLGRNYARKKHFDELLKEFKSMSGTRYNPELVKMIEGTPELRQSLSELLERGWEYNYYEVYLDYFGTR